MPLFTKAELRARAARATVGTRATTLLAASARAYSPAKTYDIFLSHAFLDAEAVLGLKLTLEDQGLSVYVDWIDDPQLDRAKVTRANAQTLRNRMRTCRSLFYAASSNSESSKWMSWELGYFDGYRGKVAIVPVVESYQSSFEGQEYLSLYPWVDKYGATLFVNGLVGTNPVQAYTTWLVAA